MCRNVKLDGFSEIIKDLRKDEEYEKPQCIGHP